MNLKNLLMLFIASFISVNAYASVYEIQPNVDNCTPGKFSQAEIESIVKLVNDIRARHKIAPIPWNEQGAIEAQAASLCMAVSGNISHSAVTSKCSNANSIAGRKNSNLHLGQRSGGPTPTSFAPIISWLKDDHPPNTATNTCTGHRRLVINPYLKSFAFGKVDAPHPTSAGWQITGAAFWGGETSDNFGGSLCENDYIAYPYGNYPPAWVNKENILSFHPLVDNTWFPFTLVNFSQTTIKMTDESGNNVAVHNIAWDYEGHGILRNGLIWRAVGLRDSVRYTVRINNILIGGNPRNYEYWFKLTDEPVNPPPPLAEIPTLLSPANNSQNLESPVVFRWNKAENAEYYSIQGALINDFSHIRFEANELTDTTYTLTAPLTSNNRYYWRVAAYNADGIASEYSEVWIFNSKEILPDPPTLIYPEPEIVNEDVARRVEFIWSSIAGAESYDLRILEVIGGEITTVEVVAQNQISDTTYYLTDAQMLEEFTEYAWTVRANLWTGGKTESAPAVRFKTNDEIISIEEVFENGTTVSVFPNPFATYATVSINSNSNVFASIEIFDILGSKVADLHSGNLEFGINEFKFIPINLTTGIYFCKITIGKNYKIIPLNYQQ